MSHDFEEIDTLRIQHPLSVLLKQLSARIDSITLRLANENLLNIRDTSKCEVAKHLCLDAFQEHFVFDRGIIVLLTLSLHDSDSQHELLRVIVVEDTTKITAKVFIDALGHIRHQQLLINHHLAVQLNSQQPRRHSRRIDVLVRHLVIRTNELTIFFDDSIGRIRVVVYLRDGGNTVKRCVLKRRLNVFCLGSIARKLWFERNRQRWRLDLLCDVDDFL